MNAQPQHVNREDLVLASQELAHRLQETAIERLRKQIRPAAPVHANRASSIGHPCEAYGYFNRTAWAQRAPHDYGLQSIFNEGHLHEPSILREVQEDCAAQGWTLMGQQQNFHDKAMQVTGHVDGLILVPQGAGFRSVALEVKTMSPFIWDTINTADDIKTHRKPYVQGYYGQLQAYLYLSNSEMGLWALKNKVTGLRKYVPVLLDYEHADAMFKRVERINAAVAAGDVPTKIREDDYCDDCAFRKICLGDEQREVPKINNERLLDAILVKEEMKPFHTRYEEAADTIKTEVERSELPEFEVGPYRIERRLQPEKEMKFTRKAYWSTKIRLKG